MLKMHGASAQACAFRRFRLFAQKRNIGHSVHLLRQLIEQIQTVLLHRRIVCHHHHTVEKGIHLRLDGGQFG